MGKAAIQKFPASKHAHQGLVVGFGSRGAKSAPPSPTPPTAGGGGAGGGAARPEKEPTQEATDAAGRW